MKLVVPHRFSRAIECRSNFVNLPGSFGDTRGAKIAPQVALQSDPTKVRVNANALAL